LIGTETFSLNSVLRSCSRDL